MFSLQVRLKGIGQAVRQVSGCPPVVFAYKYVVQVAR